MSSLARQSFRKSPAATPEDLSKDVALSSPPEDGISSLSWSSSANHLAVGSWDTKVRIYDVTQKAAGECRAAIGFDGPVFTCDWSKDGQMVAGAGADKTARALDLGANGGPAQQIAAHDAPIRCIRFFTPEKSNASMLVTGSWDKTVKYWDLRTSTPVATLACQERVYALDVKGPLLVVATAEKHINIVDINSPSKIFETRQSPLRSQTRAVCCFPDATGFMVGSIEGRCGCQYLNPKDESKQYTFVCHRERLEGSKNTVKCYPINAISFHPVHGTFSTAGSDGGINFWDKNNRIRMKGHTPVGGPISATAFNGDGSIFAYAVSYDWSKGYLFNTPQHVNKVMLHTVTERESKPTGSRLLN